MIQYDKIKTLRYIATKVSNYVEDCKRFGLCIFAQGSVEYMLRIQYRLFFSLF